MGRKIIGVTVGTTVSARWIKEKINPVTSVNGVMADENGNVQTELSEEEVQNIVDHALREAKESGAFDGKDGQDGKDGKDGADGYTPRKGVDYFDGKDGQNGKDGYTPIKGVDYFDGLNGKDGADGKNGTDGKDGKDGYTPVKGVDYFDGRDGKDGYTPVKGKDYFDGANGKDGKDGVNGVDGKDGVDGYSPVKGKDYWTDAERAAMVSDVIAALPVYNGEVENECTQHIEDNGVVTKTATCTRTGIRQYSCSNCGAFIRDEVIPALGHTWRYYEDESASSGMSRECTICHEIEEDV
jgi:hypothetical protein